MWIVVNFMIFYFLLLTVEFCENRICFSFSIVSIWSAKRHYSRTDRHKHAHTHTHTVILNGVQLFLWPHLMRDLNSRAIWKMRKVFLFQTKTKLFLSHHPCRLASLCFGFTNSASFSTSYNIHLLPTRTSKTSSGCQL